MLKWTDLEIILLQEGLDEGHAILVVNVIDIGGVVVAMIMLSHAVRDNSWTCLFDSGDKMPSCLT